MLFRSAEARGQNLGVTARGLSIRTAEAQGEEFPIFRAVWIEKPMPNVNVLVIHALLDSASLTGAYRFTLRPGEASPAPTGVCPDCNLSGGRDGSVNCQVTPPPWEFLQVFILKIVKALCFDTLLQVFILKALGGSCERPLKSRFPRQFLAKIMLNGVAARPPGAVPNVYSVA